jgi:hypothetical protein
VNISWFVSGGGPTPPLQAESLGVDDTGVFHLWRTVGLPVAGYFSGHLDAARLSELLKVADEAMKAGNLAIPLRPGAAQEQVAIDGVQADLGFGSAISGPWQPVIEDMRGLANDLTDRPVAAIGLEVDHAATSCRLSHLGASPVTVDLATLVLRARRLEGWYQPAGSWEAPGPALGGGQVSAEPGWSLELPFDHGFVIDHDHVVHVDVDVQLVVNGNPRFAGLRWAPVPAR